MPTNNKNNNSVTRYDPAIIGANFKKIRIASGWGQMDLALELGYSNNSQLSEFENGKGMLPMDKLHQAIQTMGVQSVDFVLRDTEISDRQARLIVNFSRKMLDLGPDGFKHFSAIESLLED
jgi:transcriptional regulator with XRE-family HTH domain